MRVWPKPPMDQTKPCGICNKPVLVKAYDDSRVKPWADSEHLGAIHLTCLNKAGVNIARTNGHVRQT